jgi:hypothetical protein
VLLLALAWELSSFLSKKVPTFVFSHINNKSGKAAVDGAMLLSARIMPY